MLGRINKHQSKAKGRRWRTHEVNWCHFRAGTLMKHRKNVLIINYMKPEQGQTSEAVGRANVFSSICMQGCPIVLIL